MLYHISKFHFFLWPSTTLLYVYTTFCLSIHLFMDTWVVSAFALLWIILLWILMYKYLFKSLLSVLLDVYLRVELLSLHSSVFFNLTYHGYHSNSVHSRSLQILLIHCNDCLKSQCMCIIYLTSFLLEDVSFFPLFAFYLIFLFAILNKASMSRIFFSLSSPHFLIKTAM